MPASGYTAITMKTSDVKQIDRLANEEHTTRQEIIRKAIKVYEIVKENGNMGR